MSDVQTPTDLGLDYDLEFNGARVRPSEIARFSESGGWIDRHVTTIPRGGGWEQRVNGIERQYGTVRVVHFRQRR